MKKLIVSFIIVSNFFSLYSQNSSINHTKIKEDLYEIINNLERYYVYLDEKKVDLQCIREYYEKQIPQIENKEDTILFFEYLLDEFYDSHVTLNTNVYASFRLFAPVYATFKNNRLKITNIWQTQIENLDQNLMGAEILKMNGTDFEQAILQFPTHCHDKNLPEVKEWIANKILAGRYDESRIITLRLTNGTILDVDLDSFKLKNHSDLLGVTQKGDIGIITINNSLGNNDLIGEFDKALDSFMDTRGLIIDLRNTVDGGNSYVARGIMGRFIDTPLPYQKHSTIESYDGNPKVERNWIEYVSPRGILYKKPVVVLVGRWTGSMGEGVAIGFEGTKRAKIVGTEMERLAGEMNGFSFKNQNFGYRLSTAKLFHINGTPREKYLPVHYVVQTTTWKDEVLENGIELLNKMMK